MNIRKPLAAGLLICAIGASIGWFYYHRDQDSGVLKLYGNVDIRQVNLAFQWPERIQSIFVEEGDRVAAGEKIARQQTDTLEIQLQQAEASEEAAYQRYLALKNGTRPEDIAKAQAETMVARSTLELAEKDYLRGQSIYQSTRGQGISKQNLDTLESQVQVAKNRLLSAQKSYELAKIGPREEDIKQAQAEWKRAQAVVSELQLKIRQSTLYAPTDAYVRSRLLQPGDMASSQVPVVSLAITSPKWVRAYIDEVNLGKIKPGQSAVVTTDSFPEQKIEGQVGFISSVAEFTPKTVETPQLRTNLVYEVRIIVDDKENHLRLGMPATVTFD